MGRCFQRDAKEKIPGGDAGGPGDVNTHDYCIPLSHTMLYLGASAHTKGKLNQCEGDCDNDSHCATGLKCFERNGKEPVPSCKSGGAGDVNNYDYCIPINHKLTNLGGSAHTKGKLSQCQGDCDNDSHCKPGLKCFQRSGKIPVPSCLSGGSGDYQNYDYCFDPLNRILLNLGGSAHTIGKLQQCQGDCDNDSQCATGLKCFQRNKKSPVPGCYVGGSGDVNDYDYCIPMLRNLGGSVHTKGKLKLCQGDCDSDSHCEPGLKCYQRNGKQSMVLWGCVSGGAGDVSGTDYCVYK